MKMRMEMKIWNWICFQWRMMQESRRIMRIDWAFSAPGEKRNYKWANEALRESEKNLRRQYGLKEKR